MNVKMSEDIVKFLVVVGACTAGVLAYNWYSEKEKQKLKNLENQPKPNNRKIEKVEEDVSIKRYMKDMMKCHSLVR